MGPRPLSEVDLREGETPISLIDALILGRNLEYLSQASRQPEQYEVGDVDGEGILGRLRDIEQVLLTTDLETPVVGEVASLREEFESQYDDPEVTLGPSRQEQLQEKSVTWVNLLKENFKDEKRIPASTTGLLDTTKLVEEPDELLTHKVWSWLDETAKNDLEEACRCIAVDCSTACVMLSLRAVEHSLRRWYEADHDEIESTGWGSVLDELMTEYATEEKSNDTVLSQLSELPPILSNLYYLKEKRNEVGHPDHSPSAQEARRTLMIVAATISEVFEEMEEIRLNNLDLTKFASRDVGDVTDIIWKVITEIEENTSARGAPREKVYETGREIGLNNEEIEDAIKELLMSGRLYESGSDRIMPI